MENLDLKKIDNKIESIDRLLLNDLSKEELIEKIIKLENEIINLKINSEIQLLNK